MILADIWVWIQRLFGKKPLDKKTEGANAEFARAYEDIHNISFGAIFANSLANKVMSDSSITITDARGGAGRRAEWVEEGIARVWNKGKLLVAQALGKGGKVLLPYVVNGKGYVDIIDQSRMSIERMQGDDIASASVLAEVSRVNGRLYYRWQDYTLENGVHSLVTRITNDAGNSVPFDTVPEWVNITPEISISRVDKILFGYLKAPIDSRRDASVYGVPITFGSEKIIEDLHTCLADMAQEYRIKRAFVGADERLFGKGGKLPIDGIFKALSPAGGFDGKAFWEVFDPAIRDSAYINRFRQLCELLEKSIGTSKGILTEPETAAATATEIKSANYDTFALVSAIRENVERAINDTAYALDVLAEHFGATPAGARGDYQITYDWDMSLLESSTETFNQLSELESRNLILPERLVSWATGLTVDEARDEVEAARTVLEVRAVKALGDEL